MDLHLNFQSLTKPQLRILKSKTRFNIAAWGRQSGKTTYGIYKGIIRPISGRPAGVYWYVLQTDNAAEIAFNRYWNLLRGTKLLAGKPNESEKFVKLANDAVIHFKSGANFENLRAETLDGVIIDEYRQQSPKLWPMIIRPMLSRYGGWADILSSPNGFDGFSDLFEQAKLNPKEWSTFHASSTEAPWWTPEEIESARRTMSEAEFAQEILAEFRDMTSGRAYINYSQANERPDSPFAPGKEYSEHLPVVVFMDFNLSPMAWTLGQYRDIDFHFADEIYINRIQSPYEPAKNLITKLRSLPFDVNRLGLIIVGDATGKAHQRTSNQSDYDIVCQELDRANIRWNNATPESNPGIKDRVNTVNARLKDANGNVHVTLDPARCPMLKKDFLRVSWRPTASPALDSGSDGMLTHPSDGIGYGICVFAPLTIPKPVGGLRVIIR